MCACMHEYECECVCMHVWACMCVCECVCVCVCVCVHVCACVCECMRTCLCVSVHTLCEHHHFQPISTEQPAALMVRNPKSKEAPFYNDPNTQANNIKKGRLLFGQGFTYRKLWRERLHTQKWKDSVMLIRVVGHWGLNDIVTTTYNSQLFKVE